MLSERFNELSQQIFQKKIEDCEVEELENLVQQYPYFAPAHYMLLARLKDADYNRHQTEIQKSILYYHDPFAFDHFINAGDYNPYFETQQEEVQLEEESVFPEPLLELITPETAEQPSDAVEVLDASDEEGAIPEVGAPDAAVENNFANTPVEELKEKEETNGELLQNEVIGDPILQKSDSGDTIALPVFHQQPIEANTGLTFEPYHTVDYFASQGIKLSQEEATKDKFGKQLKSFTEWLKTMKRIPSTEQAKPLDTGAEQKVENLAAHSVQGEEVVTETMAEVWVQQGNTEKAKEVYNKLSLLNPSKRAYFAAKIDSLK